MRFVVLERACGEVDVVPGSIRANRSFHGHTSREERRYDHFAFPRSTGGLTLKGQLVSACQRYFGGFVESMKTIPSYWSRTIIVSLLIPQSSAPVRSHSHWLQALCGSPATS